MKVVITHLKAPWPAGARLGDVVEVGESLPPPFAGKCHPAGEGSGRPAHTYEPSAASADPRVMLDAALAENAALKGLLEAGGPIKTQRR